MFQTLATPIVDIHGLAVRLVTPAFQPLDPDSPPLDPWLPTVCTCATHKHHFCRIKDIGHQFYHSSIYAL